MGLLVDEKGNDREPIQSNSTSCPEHQTGKGHPGPRQANLVLIAYASAQSRQNLRCSLIQAVSQEEPSDRRSLAPLNGWACAVKICHDGMLEDTNSLDGAHPQSRRHQKQKQHKRKAKETALSKAKNYSNSPNFCK